MEEDVKVVVGGAEFVGECFEFGVFCDHWENVFFEDLKTAARVPDYFTVEFGGGGVAGSIKAALFAGLDDIWGEHFKVAEDLEELGREEWVIP